MKRREQPSPEILELYRKSGSSDRQVALAAQREIAKALETPLRKGVLYGDIVTDIYESMPLEPGTQPEFPLDLLVPGTELEHIAYTNPGHGRIPERTVESDYVMIPTYGITSSIDFLLKYAKQSNWNVIARAMEVLEASFIAKINEDGWHTLLAAAVDRNISVYDADAAPGQFTKRLISLMKTVMLRNSGGNSVTSRGRLTDIYTSLEAVEDVRNWNVDQIDEVTRREMYLSQDGGPALSRIAGVNLNDLYEFGDGQQYQNYFLEDLGGTLGASDVELIFGIDKSSNDSFVMPVVGGLEIFEDETLHRSQRQGYYGWMNLGFAVLDGRRVLAGSF